MDVYFDPVVLKLVDILKRGLPDHSEEDIFWGYHFVTGHTDEYPRAQGAHRSPSNGVCHSDDLPAVKRRIGRFMAGGFLALKETDGPAPRD